MEGIELSWICWEKQFIWGTVGPTVKRIGDLNSDNGVWRSLPQEGKEAHTITYLCTLAEALDVIINIKSTASFNPDSLKNLTVILRYIPVSIWIYR